MWSQSPLALMASVLGALAGGSAYVLYHRGELSAEYAFIVLTVILLLYLGAQVSILRLTHPQRWLINPVVLASAATFAAGYGATNGLCLLDEDQQNLLGLPGEVTPSLVKVTALALTAAIAMWIGYWSTPARYLSSPCKVEWFQRTLLPSTATARPIAVAALVVASTGARILQVKLGVYGYSSTLDRLVELGSWTQYLSTAASLGSLALVITALMNARTPERPAYRGMLLLVLAIEVAWGFLSGFKSAVVMPFVIVGVCQYLAAGRVPVRWVCGALIGLMLAYAVIEPFRAERNQDATFTGTDLSQIVQVLLRSEQSDGTPSAERASLPLTVAHRWNLTYSGSKGVAYADAGGLSVQDPDFRENVLLAPVHAFVPRLLWGGKPLAVTGLWYHQVVSGNTTISSDAMGPVTYLYFAGGVVAVFIGFALVGVVQRVSVFLLQPWHSSPGAVVFVALLWSITAIDSSFHGFLVRLFREVPLLLILQFFLFASKVQPSRGRATNACASGSCL